MGNVKTLALAAVLLLMSCVPSFALIGETPEQCRERYGQPTKVDTGANSMYFQKSGFTIVVAFVDGKVEAITYRKIVSDIPGETVLISPDEIQLLLKSNSAGKGWEPDKQVSETDKPAWHTTSWPLIYATSGCYTGAANLLVETFDHRVERLFKSVEERIDIESKQRAEAEAVARTSLGSLVSVFCDTSIARIGETLEQCTARYGKPIRDAVAGRVAFQKAGMLIVITFSEGKATMVAYSPPTKVTDEEFKTLLRLYSGGRRWVRVPNTDWWTFDMKGCWVAFPDDHEMVVVTTLEELERGKAKKE
jgi:hypothetical protein